MGGGGESLSFLATRVARSFIGCTVFRLPILELGYCHGIRKGEASAIALYKFWLLQLYPAKSEKGNCNEKWLRKKEYQVQSIISQKPKGNLQGGDKLP